MMGSRGMRALEGKRVSLFSKKGRTSDVWKTGKKFGELGKSSVTVECRSSVFLIVKGPSNLGMNLATRLGSPALSSLRRLSVERTTLSPILKGKVRFRLLLAWKA